MTTPFFTPLSLRLPQLTSQRKTLPAEYLARGIKSLAMQEWPFTFFQKLEDVCPGKKESNDRGEAVTFDVFLGCLALTLAVESIASTG
jgi:hypothetical protein